MPWPIEWNRCGPLCVESRMTPIRIERNHTRLELIRHGFDDDAIARACARGDIDRIGVGLYGPPGHAAPTREDAHRERATLWARQCRQRGVPSQSRALADVSAAAVLGLPLWGLPTQRVVANDFTRPPGTRQSRTVRLVTDRRPPSLVAVDGLAVPVSSPARTVIDIARLHERIPAIAVGDHALHANLCTVEDLQRELDLARGMTGIHRAREYVALMTGSAESVLESRSRIEMRDLGLPTPLLQQVFLDAYGTFIGRVDFYWPEFRLVGEADGDLKYDGNPDALEREKERTDRLHEIGLRVVRWKWRTINTPQLLGSRVQSMMNATPQSTSIPRIHLAS